MHQRFFAALLPLVLLASCNRWSDARVSETKRRGDVICRAIEAFHARTGRFPTQLAQLQPDFLREIPPPTAGDKEWDYILIDEGRDYWLRVVCSEFGPQLDRNSAEGWSYMRGEK